MAKPTLNHFLIGELNVGGNGKDSIKEIGYAIPIASRRDEIKCAKSVYSG